MRLLDGGDKLVKGIRGEPIVRGSAASPSYSEDLSINSAETSAYFVRNKSCKYVQGSIKFILI